SHASTTAATAIDGAPQSAASATEVSRAGSGLTRGGTFTGRDGRTKIIGAAALLAVLIVSVSVIADRHLAHHVEHRSASPPIMRVAGDRPAVPIVAPQVIETDPRTLSAGEDSPPKPAVDTAPAHADIVPSKSPARSTRHARRHRQQT